jgi:hypothetical protein
LLTTCTVFSSDSGFSMKSNAPILMAGRLDVAVPRDHDDGRVHLAVPQPLQRHQPVDAGQPDVEQDHVVCRPGEAVEAGFAAVDGVDLVPLVAQHAHERRAHARLVVDHQDGRLHVSSDPAGRSASPHGSSMVNLVPRGSLAPTSTDPPCSATMRRTIASPRPLPRFFVE